MAIRHQSAIKAARQAEKRRDRNRAALNTVKSQIKRVLTAVETKKVDDAKTALRDATATLAKAVSKGLMKPNTASRRIARLAHQVNSLA
jgi:small subunit ribosomal protein S20